MGLGSSPDQYNSIKRSTPEERADHLFLQKIFALLSSRDNYTLIQALVKPSTLRCDNGDLAAVIANRLHAEGGRL
jgi:hypothetical protein